MGSPFSCLSFFWLRIEREWKWQESRKLIMAEASGIKKERIELCAKGWKINPSSTLKYHNAKAPLFLAPSRANRGREKPAFVAYLSMVVQGCLWPKLTLITELHFCCYLYPTDEIHYRKTFLLTIQNKYILQLHFSKQKDVIKLFKTFCVLLGL